MFVIDIIDIIDAIVDVFIDITITCPFINQRLSTNDVYQDHRRT